VRWTSSYESIDGRNTWDCRELVLDLRLHENNRKSTKQTIFVFTGLRLV
jgi:hypothetical protein